MKVPRGDSNTSMRVEHSDFTQAVKERYRQHKNKVRGKENEHFA